MEIYYDPETEYEPGSTYLFLSSDGVGHETWIVQGERTLSYVKTEGNGFYGLNDVVALDEPEFGKLERREAPQDRIRAVELRAAAGMLLDYPRNDFDEPAAARAEGLPAQRLRRPPLSRLRRRQRRDSGPVSVSARCASAARVASAGTLLSRSSKVGIAPMRATTWAYSRQTASSTSAPWLSMSSGAPAAS